MALSQTTRRVFLYLQPRSILYNRSANNVSSEIELNHPSVTITKLTDRYTSENVIQLEEFASEKPTFSVTIEQDNIRDINAFSDLPMTLTLYERHIPETSSERMSQTSAASVSASQQYKAESRQPLLQGYIDMLQFFVNKRSKWAVDVILYPLKKEQKINTCKTKWHIYALIPIIKDIKLSNAIYVTLASIFNANDNLLNDCNDLVATLSWQCKIPSKLKGFKKIFICKYTVFSRATIGKDNGSTFCKWESLKSEILQNYDSISVRTEISLDIASALFSLARPEDIPFNFTKVDIETNDALVCNSLHRFILTDSMHNSLQEHLINSQLNLVLDIFKASKPNDILLQGSLDVSILLYPHRSAFAVPMRRPEKGISNTTIEKHNWSEPIPFAVIKICLKVPVTEPAEDLNIRFHVVDIETEIYKICRTSFMRSKRYPQYRDEKICEKSYREFDKTVLKMVDTYIRTNLHSKLGREYSSCPIVSDTINTLLPLIKCDFNVRFPTKTNVEFTLKKMYSKSPYFRFFMFIYDIEMGRYESARDYLKRPSYIIDIPEEAFREFCCSLIEIYLAYETHGIGAEENNSTADESLIKALIEFCEFTEPNSKVGWMLLYCTYKKYNYRPGMSYARFNYENVIKGGFTQSMCLPKSRWEIFNNYIPKSQSEKFQYFWEPINFLLCLGLYKFASWMFEEVADNCSEVERYILETSLKFHMGSIGEDFIPQNFVLNSEFNKAELEAFVLLINGNAQHFLHPFDDSSYKDYYSGILNITDLTNTYDYQVGIIRYAFRMGAKNEYEEAIRAFDFSGHYEEHRLITYMGKGKSLYYLGRLKEAKDYLADLTSLYAYNPNTWFYLALINLQLGDKDNALECWKYAHLNRNRIREWRKIDFRPRKVIFVVDPHMHIHEDLLKELEEINLDDVPL
uniref:TPR_REGION domain-containing protein n=1 Tax=Glossina austeni TaxID=7395 RepID=A0A1A9UW05_GLOAU